MSRSTVSCVSLPGLPTITETPPKTRASSARRLTQNKRRHRRHDTNLAWNNKPIKKPKSLCALFDFETFILDSEWMDEDEMKQRQRKYPDLAISSMAIQEWTNSRIHTTITLITLPPRLIAKLETARLPILGREHNLYVTKYRNESDGTSYLRLCTQRPNKKNKDKEESLETNDGIKCAQNGMVFAIILSTFPNTKKWVINGVYFHGHGSPVYQPDFNGKEKDLRACKPYDIFICDQQNAIKTIKPFKRKRAKSVNCNASSNTSNLCHLTLDDIQSDTKFQKRKHRDRKYNKSVQICSRKTLKKKQNGSRSSKKLSKSTSPGNKQYLSPSDAVYSAAVTTPYRGRSKSSQSLRRKKKNGKSATMTRLPSASSLSAMRPSNEQSVSSSSSSNKKRMKTKKKKSGKTMSVCNGDLFKSPEYNYNNKASIDSALSSQLKPIKEAMPLRTRKNTMPVRSKKRWYYQP